MPSRNHRAIRQYRAGPRAAERHQRFQQTLFVLKPTVGVCGFEHREFAADLKHGDRHFEFVFNAGEDVAAVADASLTKADAAKSKPRAAIVSAAQGVLDARAAHPESSRADLYDPAMPPDSTKAHQKLDAAVDAAYFAAHVAVGATKAWRNDAERVAFLFTLYQKFTRFLPTETAKPKSSRKAKTAVEACWPKSFRFSPTKQCPAS